jgi:ferritin-like metal-binding protein YciE
MGLRDAMNKLTGQIELNSMEDLFCWEIQDLYDAEQRLVDALPKMADAAHSPELKQAFQKHLAQTRRQVTRLEEVFSQIGREPERTTCAAMEGLIEEGKTVINASGDSDVRDAALIGAAQRVEHYEIAGYGTVRTFAQRLGHDEAAQLLQTTLDEEAATDKEFTRLAEEVINIRAQQHA